MRFLVLTQYFPPEIGAPQVRLKALATELVKLGHDVEVVTALPNHPSGRIFPGYKGRFYLRELEDSVIIHRVWLYPSVGAGFKRLLNYGSFAITSLLGLIRSKKPDYIFVESPPLFLSVPGFIASRLWDVPLIFNVADLWPDSVRELGIMRDGFALRMAARLERWTYRKATYINAVTEGIHSVLKEGKDVPPQKVLFLPNGVNTSLFKPSSPDEGLAEEVGLVGRKVILYAGTLGFAQGLEVAIRAMELLHSCLPEAVLVFIGDGSEKEGLTRTVRELELHNVRFIPPHPPEFVARLYSIAFAGFASLKNIPLFEGARPSKIFPIMACGKPVIYSGAGEGARLVEEARAGIVVPPEDPEALAGAIRRLAENPNLAAELGQNGRRYVEENLSWPVLVRNWLTQLEEKERART